MVRLCGEQNKFVDRFIGCGFGSSQPMSIVGDTIVYTGKYLKTTPELALKNLDEIRAFVVGYLDADGAKSHSETNKNKYLSIQSSQQDHIDFIESAFEMVGVYILNKRDLTGQETNFGIRPTTTHFGLTHNIGHTNTKWSVKSIEEDVEEEVWCLIVDEKHSFVLSGGIATGNCSYLPLMKTPKSVLVIGVAGCLSSALCSTALTPTAAAADTTLSLLQQSSTDAVAIMAQNSGTAPIFTSPTALVLSAQKGQTAVGTLNLKKSSTDQHSYYLSTNQGWVWMNPPYGSTQTITTETDQLVITAQTANLPTGTHSAVVYIVDSGPNNFTNMLRIPVTLTVTATAVTPPPPPAAVPPAIIPTPSPVAVPPPPAPTPVVAPVVTGTAITSSPAALALSAVKGQTAVGTLSLRKGGTDQHSYYLSTNQGWVWMNPPYGSTQTITTETDQLVITAQTANLAAGTHSAVVYIVDSGPNNFTNMLRIPVTLTVTATAVTPPPPPPPAAVPPAIIPTPSISSGFNRL